MSDITEITNITDEQKRELREKSMRYMVDSPSSKGLSPQVIKQRMVGYVLDDTNSIIAIIDGLIDKINTNEANLQERIEDIETSNEFIVVESASGTLTETQVELLTNNNNCYLVYKDASNNYEIYKLAKKESTQYLYDCILGNSVKTLTLTLSSGAYSIASLTNENVANKVTTLDNSDDHYPSAKAVKTKVDDITEDISDIKQAYVVSAEIVASGDHEGELKITVIKNGVEQSPIYFEGGSDAITAAQWDAINSGITAGKVSSYDSHISNTSNPHSVTASQVGLGNVDNTSDATKKTNFTGSIASDNTGFVLGGDVYTALSGKQATIDSSHKLSADLVDDTNSTNKFVTASDKTTWNGKSVVSVSDTGTAIDEVNYITVNGTEKKLAGGATVTFVDWS